MILDVLAADVNQRAADFPREGIRRIVVGDRRRAWVATDDDSATQAYLDGNGHREIATPDLFAIDQELDPGRSALPFGGVGRAGWLKLEAQKVLSFRHVAVRDDGEDLVGDVVVAVVQLAVAHNRR